MFLLEDIMENKSHINYKIRSPFWAETKGKIFFNNTLLRRLWQLDGIHFLVVVFKIKKTSHGDIWIYFIGTDYDGFILLTIVIFKISVEYFDVLSGRTYGLYWYLDYPYCSIDLHNVVCQLFLV